MPGWDDMDDDLRRRISAIRSGLFALSQAYAGQMTSDMRRDARWRNRTGNARGGLHAVAYQAGNEIGIRAAHTVEYGRWLELGIDRWSSGPDVGQRERTRTGRMGYPVIHNTVAEYWPRYARAAQELVNRGMRA